MVQNCGTLTDSVKLQRCNAVRLECTHPDVANQVCFLVLRDNFAPVGPQTPIYSRTLSSCVPVHGYTLHDLEATSINNLLSELLELGSKRRKSEVLLSDILYGVTGKKLVWTPHNTATDQNDTV